MTNALDHAIAFLAERLRDGPHPAVHVAEDAQRAGISAATLRRAKAYLRVTSLKEAMAFGWWWDLPMSKPSTANERLPQSHEGDQVVRAP